ncbi:MAG: OB-fold nucleic acid binding domain-containing protein [Candidatus Nanohaloarchaea archaeon]|nr:OB-fold nucleic acid binding domain-containing protein [Candidatus Nanohaloarchaea archaeon]
MDIEDLTVESEDVELEATIEDIEVPRVVSGKYGQKKITVAELEDGTGEIQVTLWEEQIDAVEEGETVKVEGAYTRDWAGELQLNIPRDGSIEVLE